MQADQSAEHIGGAAVASLALGGAAAAAPIQGVQPKSVGDQLEAKLKATADKLKTDAVNLEKDRASAEKQVKARKSGETVKQTKAREAKEARAETKRIEEAKATKEAKEKLISPITALANKSKTQVQEGPEGTQPRNLTSTLEEMLLERVEQLEDTQE